MNVKLLDFYNRLNNDVLESLNLQISKVGSRGKAKTCYESVILKDLISNLKLDEEKK
ncbi:hypothetical protein JTS96_03945 [Clostridium botulinum]|nr:hypothetical protein [Clostridium botulinum]